MGEKAYKLYDIDNHKISISRDVVFHEDIFPYHNLSSTTFPTPLPYVDLVTFDCSYPSQPIPPTPSMSSNYHNAGADLSFSLEPLANGPQQSLPARKSTRSSQPLGLRTMSLTKSNPLLIVFLFLPQIPHLTHPAHSPICLPPIF